jgi:hypothetical protein
MSLRLNILLFTLTLLYIYICIHICVTWGLSAMVWPTARVYGWDYYYKTITYFIFSVLSPRRCILQEFLLSRVSRGLNLSGFCTISYSNIALYKTYNILYIKRIHAARGFSLSRDSYIYTIYIIHLSIFIFIFFFFFIIILSRRTCRRFVAFSLCSFHSRHVFD